MRFLVFVLIAFISVSCNQPDRIVIDGSAPGIKSGVFGVVDVLNKPVYGDNIVDGKFKINELLEYPGYYNVKVTNMLDSKSTHIPYEVYLENGEYIIELNNDITKYPKITTSSQTQNEVSAYYVLADELLADIKKQVSELTLFLKSDRAKGLPANNYLAQVEQLKALRVKEKNIEATVIEKFIEKYPQSAIAAHFIYNLDYKSDPPRYNALFNKLSDAAKNTEEGKELSAKLGQLVKLVPGWKGPAINGTTPDGKKFDPKEVSHKKIILVDFWRAGNQVSRINHDKIIKDVFFQVNYSKDFGVISINLDERKDWWENAIKEDKMKWPQYSDLKGNDSKDAEAWGITRVPTYYLMDGNWKIIRRDVPFDDVAYEVTQYLERSR
ncbi:hypothetical protein DJ568_13165 [Mucilaginibacter hurinus]|uniref:Uncharacterized protein n=1 Tax=Mucilaginibacter hurinus TaxID=2201324 RepID=A0A367GNH7_9SPHI|nr:thioredoxin family protein [Mucilaginibacter hurinus]RCH54243.1 hypothetical protein DJ568_13165 [Mucilaginibacter hurinus]